MKYFFIGILFLLFSCAKNDIKLNTGWNALYHIENNDTISYMYFPNAFSPNGNGSNDMFNVITSSVSPNNYELKIYRKSGEVVFLSTNFIIGWDGTNKGVRAISGLYYYKIIAEDYTGFKYDATGSLYLNN